MGKRFFFWEYLLEGLVVGTAATGSLPMEVFLGMFVAIFAVVYWRDGLQTSTLYYIPIAAAMLIGHAIEMENINMYAVSAVVILQFTESAVYNLPENKRLVGFRKRIIKEEGQEYFEFYPIVQNNAVKSSICWNQGRGFEKIIESKEKTGIFRLYQEIALSYIKRMTITVGIGQQIATKNGMAFCHGRDAAPIWYSSLMVQFASNNYKVGARQHPNLVPLNQTATKEAMKRLREGEVQIAAEQYFSVIQELSCEKIVLVAHSYGCSALLQAYHDHYSKLSAKVTHIILLDPYLFPLPDHLLTKKVDCPLLILANQYLLNFEDVHERFRIISAKKNVSAVVWKESSDLYQTDLCFLFSNGLKLEEWEGKFKDNLKAIDIFMQEKPLEDAFGERDLGKKYKPEQYLPQSLFIF